MNSACHGQNFRPAWVSALALQTRDLYVFSPLHPGGSRLLSQTYIFSEPIPGLAAILGSSHPRIVTLLLLAVWGKHPLRGFEAAGRALCSRRRHRRIVAVVVVAKAAPVAGAAISLVLGSIRSSSMMGPISIVAMPLAQGLERSGEKCMPIFPVPASVVLAVCPELRAH